MQRTTPTTTTTVRAWSGSAANMLAFILLMAATMAALGESSLKPDALSAAAKGTKWAVLVAGSNGYENFRHQADVCHAYQILKKNGMKDENIIVFMYNDIAHNSENPTPGIIINKPGGPDVYKGVPKDYTGDSTTAANLYAVLLGNKTALTGGSGKVLRSGPNDNVFIFYSDHGSPGVIGMPVGDNVYATDLTKVLKAMRVKKIYKSMVIYVEACEAGSLFQGLLPNNINIYATTASNPVENSYGYYCPGDYDHPDVSKYGTCLGDLYSISWMEDSDVNNLASETLKQQYNAVKKRTTMSHVMQYGYSGISRDFLSTYMGENLKSASSRVESIQSTSSSSAPTSRILFASQRDANLRYYQHKARKAPKGSPQSAKAHESLSVEIFKRQEEDRKINLIVNFLLGSTKSSMAFNTVRPAGQALVDDWDCFKSLVSTYEQRCGHLSTYGRKYTGVMANLCNLKVNKEQFDRASLQAC
ncbi:hypothetical protein MLD38_021346 [Melastoma candidum]|uniref:Uncharacterized protein n=1 Tax=Melastoma candidum TaxID=119954 RepID=A0ACB9QFP8_9MYRT|nr:hypothetical protein MLD38_021346 [Melastoma candidum]